MPNLVPRQGEKFDRSRSLVEIRERANVGHVLGCSGCKYTFHLLCRTRVDACDATVCDWAAYESGVEHAWQGDVGDVAPTSCK